MMAMVISVIALRMTKTRAQAPPGSQRSADLHSMDNGGRAVINYGVSIETS